MKYLMLLLLLSTARICAAQIQVTVETDSTLLQITGKDTVVMKKPPFVKARYVEITPARFNGDINQYIKRHLVKPAAYKGKYPQSVTVYCEINEKGKVIQAVIVSATPNALDAPAKRVVLGMPAWQPAVVEGKHVSTFMDVVVVFE